MFLHYTNICSIIRARNFRVRRKWRVQRTMIEEKQELTEEDYRAMIKALIDRMPLQKLRFYYIYIVEYEKP